MLRNLNCDFFEAILNEHSNLADISVFDYFSMVQKSLDFKKNIINNDYLKFHVITLTPSLNAQF